MRESWKRFRLTAPFLLACSAPGCRTPAKPLDAEPPRLEFLADFNIPAHYRAPELGPDEFGGISALWYAPGDERWLALSDARDRSRLYELQVELQGVPFAVIPRRVVHFRDDQGAMFAARSLDPEGIVAKPDGILFISTEGDALATPPVTPEILEVDRDGNVLRRFTPPERFLGDGVPPTRGVRNNRGFEAMAISPDGTRLFVGAEESLVQDGASPSYDKICRARIILFSLDDDGGVPKPLSEVVFVIDPVKPVEGFEGPTTIFSGLVELAALSSTRLLALQRTYVVEREGAQRGINRVHLFELDVNGATDVSGVASLQEAPDGLQPVTKKLLLDFDDIVPRLDADYATLDNFEAMALGPVDEEGGRPLVIASDDNFSDSQRTAFLLFRLRGAQ